MRSDLIGTYGIPLTADGACQATSYIDLMSGFTLANESNSRHLFSLPSDLPNITDKSKKITCIPRNLTENETFVNEVDIVNSTGLLHHLGAKNESEGRCAVVLFYAPWCMFCASIGPHYNALARAFPQLHVLAIDAAHFSK